MELPRRIQITGKNTYILSLPHSWIEKSKISRGTVVYIKENTDGSLRLTTNPDKEEGRQCTISVSANALSHAIRNIVSAYVSGASTIVLKGEEPYTLAEEARKVLSGVEITDETEHVIVMKIRTDFVDLQYDSIVRRVYNITKAMFSLTIKAFGEGERHAEELKRKESEVDRLYLLALRQIASSSARPAHDEAVFKSIAAKSIEKVSDHLEAIYVSGDALMPNKEIARLLAKSLDVYSAAYGFFADGKPSVVEFETEKDEFMILYERLEGSIKKEKDMKKVLALKSIYDMCLKIVRSSADIVESGNDLLFSKVGGAEHGL